MKKFISVMLVIAVILGVGIGVSAADVQLLTYSNEVIEMTANEEVVIEIGDPGDNIRITDVQSSTYTIPQADITKSNSTATDAATVTFTPITYSNSKLNGTITISYREDGGSVQKVRIRIEVYPEEIDISGDSVWIEDGVSYRINSRTDDTVYFDFDIGTYVARVGSSQGRVNLSYDHKLTYEMAEQFPDIVDAIVFRGTHEFSNYGTLKIDAFRNGDRVYVYYIAADGAITPLAYNASEKAYTQRTRKLGTYIVSAIEVEIPVDPDPEPDAQSKPEPNTNNESQSSGDASKGNTSTIDDVINTNVNDNPGTGC